MRAMQRQRRRELEDAWRNWMAALHTSTEGEGEEMHEHIYCECGHSGDCHDSMQECLICPCKKYAARQGDASIEREAAIRVIARAKEREFLREAKAKLKAEKRTERKRVWLARRHWLRHRFMPKAAIVAVIVGVIGLAALGYSWLPVCPLCHETQGKFGFDIVIVEGVKHRTCGTCHEIWLHPDGDLQRAIEENRKEIEIEKDLIGPPSFGIELKDEGLNRKEDEGESN